MYWLRVILDGFIMSAIFIIAGWTTLPRWMVPYTRSSCDADSNYAKTTKRISYDNLWWMDESDFCDILWSRTNNNVGEIEM